MDKLLIQKNVIFQFLKFYNLIYSFKYLKLKIVNC